MKNKFKHGGGVLATLLLAILFCFASCSNGSSDSGGSQGSPYDINYSLGNPPDEKWSFEKLGLGFSAEEDSEGIYLEFDIPKDISQYRVSIEGLGAVAESIYELNEERTRGCFFYPFVDAGKEYTIRIVFLREEDHDKDDYSLGHVGDDGTIGWFQTNVKAGSKSKGEVRFTSKGEIFVDKRGNFRFIERPTFQNEKLLGNNWFVEIGLVEGISWAHGDERKTDWHGSVQIPQADLLKQINFFEKCPWLPGIDFICVRPVLENYEHNGKKYRYQWDGFVEDIFYPSKADRTQTIDINNPQDVAKIIGTWKESDYWEGGYQFQDGNKIERVKCESTSTLTISAQNLQSEDVDIYTKPNGIAFTEEEQGFWDVIENLEYEDLKQSKTISDDGKTVTIYIWNKTTLSEYFLDYSNEESKYTQHKELQVFLKTRTWEANYG